MKHTYYFYSFSKTLCEFFIKVPHHPGYGIYSVELLSLVSFHDPHGHLNVLDLFRHCLIVHVDLMKQGLCGLIAGRLPAHLSHDPLEVRVAIFVDGVDKPEPLLILHSIDGLLRVDRAAQDDVVGEPFFVKAPGVRQELLTLNYHVKFRAVGLRTHRLHALFIRLTHNSNDEIHKHNIAYQHHYEPESPGEQGEFSRITIG